MILVGLGFKASAAPFHMWTPDVYQGAPTPVTAFMSAATKVAALVLMLRVLVTRSRTRTTSGRSRSRCSPCASLAIGNLAALVQRNVKRMLAYSSISHAGFMLIAIAADNALGARALLYYLIPYSAMSLGAFAVVAARERELAAPVTLDNLAGHRLGAAVARRLDVGLHARLRRLPAHRRLRRQVLRLLGRLRRGWWWLDGRRRRRDAVSLYYYLGVVRAMYMRACIELQLAPAAARRRATGCSSAASAPASPSRSARSSRCSRSSTSRATPTGRAAVSSFGAVSLAADGAARASRLARPDERLAGEVRRAPS